MDHLRKSRTLGILLLLVGASLSGPVWLPNLMSSSWEVTPVGSTQEFGIAVAPLRFPNWLLSRIEQFTISKGPLEDRVATLTAASPQDIYIVSSNLEEGSLSTILIAQNVTKVSCGSNVVTCIILDRSGKAGLTDTHAVRWLTPPTSGKVISIWLSEVDQKTILWLLLDSSLYTSRDLGVSWREYQKGQQPVDLVGLNASVAFLILKPSKLIQSLDTSHPTATLQHSVMGTVNAGLEWKPMNINIPIGQTLTRTGNDTLLEEIAYHLADDRTRPKSTNYGLVEGYTDRFSIPIDNTAGGLFRRKTLYYVAKSDTSITMLVLDNNENIYYSDDGAHWHRAFSPDTTLGNAGCGVAVGELKYSYNNSIVWLYRQYTRYDGAQGIMVSKDLGKTWHSVQIRQPVQILTSLYKILPTCSHF